MTKWLPFRDTVEAAASQKLFTSSHTHTHTHTTSFWSRTLPFVHNHAFSRFSCHTIDTRNKCTQTVNTANSATCTVRNLSWVGAWKICLISTSRAHVMFKKWKPCFVQINFRCPKLHYPTNQVLLRS